MTEKKHRLEFVKSLDVSTPAVFSVGHTPEHVPVNVSVYLDCCSAVPGLSLRRNVFEFPTFYFLISSSFVRIHQFALLDCV